MKTNIKITRFSKLKGFDNIIAGRDFSNIFKEGHVYSVIEVLDTIMIKDLGEYALLKKYKGYKFSQIMMEGSYLLTKEEYKKQPDYTPIIE